MAKVEPFDAAEYLDSPEMIETYLAEAFESGDPAAIAMALEAVARSQDRDKASLRHAPKI
jgi:probable addiction module antidote protein